MSELECAATNGCGRICDALAHHGVERGDRLAGDCRVPELFRKTNGSVVADVPDAADVKNPALVTSLLESLYPLISERDPHLGEVRTVQERYRGVFETRSMLWQEMGDAARSRRTFTDVELEFYWKLVAQKQRDLNEIGDAVVTETLLRGQAAFDHETMRAFGIVFDEQAIDTLDRLAVNGMDGKSTLLVGEKGIAKTQLARFMAKFMSGDKEPVFLSGHGDQTADEFIGRDYQDPETGMFVFKHGKLIDAMKHGLPVVVDEINLADQSITMRLQDILLRKPGDTIILHENGNEEIEIAPGFVVFATANEASERYRHRVVLDPAFRDRFDIVTLRYPDNETAAPMLDTPATTMRLALAAASNEDGTISRYVSAADIDTITRVAHVTQRLYSVPLKDAGNLEGLDTGTTTSQYLSADKPLMNDCLTPRSMVGIVQRCAAGNKIGMNIWSELEKAVVALDQGGSQVNSTLARKILQFYRSA